MLENTPTPRQTEIRISVLVPVYGVEKYIGQCCHSLFSQTMTDGIEFIFVNDCTPDRSMEVLNEVLQLYPERIPQTKIITAPENGGSATTRNIALSHAKGRYVINCDSDDWVEHDMYQSLLSHAEATNADMVICQYINEYSSKQELTDIPDFNDPVEYTDAMLKGSIHCGTWNKLVRRELFENHSIRYPDGVNMWEDVNVIIPLSYYTKTISILKKPLYHYRQTNTESYTKRITPKALDNMVATISSLEKFVCHTGNPMLIRSLNFFKLTAKLNIMINSGKDIQKRSLSLYPEANAQIWEYKVLSKYWKIGLTLLSWKQLSLFRGLLWLRNNAL